VRTLTLLALTLLAWPPALSAQAPPATPGSSMNKITPILTVDAIEPCLPFWTDALGFELTATVPHGDAMGFAMLNRGNLEVMYQTRASVEEDLGPAGAAEGHPDLAERMAAGMATLFVQVEAIDPVIEALGEGMDVVVPRRETFYGMDEIFVRAPCGTLVGFAAPVEGGGEEG